MVTFLTNYQKDYEQFEQILEEAVTRYDMRVLAYCVMLNHWHLVLHPKQDGDLANFMSSLANTHTSLIQHYIFQTKEWWLTPLITLIHRKECLGWAKYTTADLPVLQTQLKQFLRDYNTERPHLSLDMKAPIEMLSHLG